MGLHMASLATCTKPMAISSRLFSGLPAQRIAAQTKQHSGQAKSRSPAQKQLPRLAERDTARRGAGIRCLSHGLGERGMQAAWPAQTGNQEGSRTCLPLEGVYT